MAIETRLNHRWRETKTQHTQAFSDDCCKDALPISSIIDGTSGTKGSSSLRHYGFLYEVKRGFRCVESQILNASSTGFSNIRLCTFDEPIKMDILKLKKVVQKVT